MPEILDPTLVGLTFHILPVECGAAELGENDVRICSSQFEQITGETATHNRLKPWKGRVVRVKSVTGDAIYRLIRGHGTMAIPKGKAWLGPQSRSQLAIVEGGEVSIQTVWQPLGRFLYYHGHREDAVRFTFRISLWGLIFAVASISLSVWQLVASR